MQIERVGIAGLGEMGSGIAQVVASGGYPIAAWDINEESLPGNI